MGRLISMISLSLDGFFNDRDGGLGWSSIDPELHTYLNEQCAGIGHFINGRKNFEVMDAFWPTADEDPASPGFVIEFARIWRQTPKTVVSQTLTEAPEGYTLVRDDVPAEVAKLKAASERDLMVGGPTLTRFLAAHGLVDVYHLFIHPTILGGAGGARMFGSLETPAKLQLTDHRYFTSGVVYLEYQVID